MPIPPEANVRLKVEADITKRSKPVRYAKAPLTRFGSVLRGTDAPLRTPLLAAPLRDSSRRAKALWSETRGRSAPRFAHKGNKVKRLCPASRPQTLAGLCPSGSPRGENNRPGGGVPARASVPRIRALLPLDFVLGESKWRTRVLTRLSNSRSNLKRVY